MFKQPAENTNATPLDEQRSVQRMDPSNNPADEQLELEKEAKRIASERGTDVCSEDDWSRASQIVHNRKISLSKA